MSSLNVRSGPLGRRLAHHLLSRVTYNINPARIDYFASKTATQAVNELFDPGGSPPLWPDGPLDASGVPIFSDLDYRHQPGFGYNGANRRRAIETWRIYEAMNSTTVKWKLIHFLASIFSVKAAGTIYNFHYWRLLERLAFSDLKTFALKVTYDQHMMRYLNNNANVKSAPNENYAREFLELFTILRGPQIGTGNYTTYTEADISLAAKVLSGTRTRSDVQNVDPSLNLIAGYNNVNFHDTSNKTFTAAFNNRTIVGRTTHATMTDEITDFIDMVFDQTATALSYTRKMYYFFVNDYISPDVETSVIVPLANQLNSSGYDYVAALKTLLESVHFYDEDDNASDDETVSCKVKSPYELLLTTKNLLEADHLRDSNAAAYTDQIFRLDFGSICNNHLSLVGLNTAGPNTVEGYSGWNDDGRSRNWFTSNLLYRRFTYGISFKRGKIRETNGFFPYKTDMVAWVERNIDVTGGPGTPQSPIGAADANLVIEKMLGYLIIELPTSDRLDYFANKLLGGLSTINWYFVWKNYVTSGDDTDARIGIERLYDAILSSPEFQTF